VTIDFTVQYLQAKMNRIDNEEFFYGQPIALTDDSIQQSSRPIDYAHILLYCKVRVEGG
jgi:hypothetical protein